MLEELVNCNGCKVDKPGGEYHTRNGKRHGRVCKACASVLQKGYHAANREQRLATQRRANRKLKLAAVNAYGGKCACCGETELIFLSLDHVNKDGGEHRKKLGKESSGSYLYRQLRDAGWPNDPPLQVLCFNCNFASYWGVCPHQLASDEGPTSAED